MTWSEGAKVQYLLRLPWSIVPSTEDGERVLRVRELPSVVVSGPADTEAEQQTLAADFWDSVAESLRCYLHFGDPLPRPPGVSSFPWERPGGVLVFGRRMVLRGRSRHASVETSAPETTASL